MKNFYTVLLFLFAAFSTFAQAPEKMSYQAVLRDATNTLLTSEEVGMQISILQTSITGTAVYVETQTATTNTNGLVSIEIGTGTSSDDFSAIDWSAGPYFIKTATDPSGGTTYTITGTSQIMSVPFAMYAKTSGSSTPGPQGATGLQGEPGTTGITGVTGAQGDIGATGATGIQGTIGDIGAQGDIGATGETGETGAQGEIGTSGATGITGRTGDIGAQGDIGATGANGATGLQGEPGTTGITGNIGATGAQGDIGATGVTGAEGAQGTTGITGRTGETGAQGDIGATGLQGEPGTTGITGETGETGAQGEIGTSGVTGAEGAQGATGITGTTGETGAQGDIGATGLQGEPGTTGITGVTTGDMQYWNGTAWVVIATTLNEGAALQMISGLPTWIGGTPPPPAIGDLRDGGVVFWVDPSDNTHGLVCALSDYATTVAWGCGGTNLPSVPNVAYNGGNPLGSGAEIGDGESNTTGILTDCSTAPAALAARSYGDEWFLPSIKELKEIYINKATLEAVSGFTAFSNNFYWSSTEEGNYLAWLQVFSNGIQSRFDKNYPDNVRAVRAF
jgi:hypothetical protein